MNTDADSVDPAEPSPPVPPAPPAPSAAVLWTLRLLALAGLGVGLFLLYIHIFPALTDTPFCSAFTWMDCDAVLTHARWSKWLGVPVSAPATLLYAGVTVLLFMLGRRTGETAGRWIWWLLHAAAVCIALAAVWFIYVQVTQIGRICTYCMVEHAIGLVLALLIWVHGTVAGRLGGSPVLPALAGLVLTGALVGGQMLDEPTYARSVVGEVDDVGRYVEEVDADRAIVLRGGAITLNPEAHPTLGSPDAPRMIVEAVDYTCPRCRRLADLMRDAEEELGPDYAVLVLTFPLDATCNQYLNHTHDRHRSACYLANLAHAVWLVDASKFAEFHQWLFDHQDEMTREAALAEAERLVDPAELAGRRADGYAEQLVKRDIGIFRRTNVRQLPGLFVGNSVFTSVPEEPSELAEAIRGIFEDAE